MKIAWYTPYSKESAIGRFSEDVVASLVAAEHDVCIVRSEHEGKSNKLSCRHTKASKIVWAEDIDAYVSTFLNDFDLVFYNVGDNFRFHSWAVTHQRIVPGITILHDFFLHNLMSGWAKFSTDPMKVSYESALHAECGIEALLHYQKEVEESRSDEWFLGKANGYSVFAFALRHTLGIVTHAQFYAQVCWEKSGVPVATIPLSYRGLLAEKRSPNASRQRRTVITVGNANPNKCYKHVILALGECPDRSKGWLYRIVGQITEEFREELTVLAKSTPYPVTLEFAGTVDDVALQREYQTADAVVCMRNPVLEGASASLIESLQNGIPTIVSRAGCYAEIPDPYVFKVEPGFEERDLAQYFQFISSNFEAAEMMGLKAAEWAKQFFHSDNYANRLMEFAVIVVRERSVLELVERLACRARPFTNQMPKVWREHLSAKLDELFPTSSLRHDELLHLKPLHFDSRLKTSFVGRNDEGLGVSAYYCRKSNPTFREHVQITAVGCHKLEQLHQQTSFWTKGACTLDFLFIRSCLVRWAWVEIIHTGPFRKPIIFKIDGRVVAISRRKGSHWVRIRLPRFGKVRRIIVSVETKPFIPSEVITGSEDTRELGVAVGRIFFAKYWWRFSPRLEKKDSWVHRLIRRIPKSVRD